MRKRRCGDSPPLDTLELMAAAAAAAAFAVAVAVGLFLFGNEGQSILIFIGEKK